jgi:NADH-quinone oxidoreductase subunit N
MDNLILLYLALELQALALYTLVGFFKFEEERTDSALKYLLSGSLVSGFMLLGFARWYGLNGGFHLGESADGVDPLGSAWVVGVLLFKVGVVPFHFWTPLAYTPLEWGTLGVTLGATKVNIWYLLVNTFGDFLRQAWWPTWWAGVASVVVGSLGGYFQTSVGGLLAYSGVINGGYLVLLSTVAPNDGGFTLGYYLGVYLGGTLAVVTLASTWGDTRVSGFAVWGKLGVTVPLVLYYLCLSLGGLPVFPGFFAKLALLAGLGGFGFFFIGGLVICSVGPAVYYVSLAVGALFSPVEQEVNPPGRVHPVVVGYLTLGVNGLVLLLWGLK